MPCGYMTYVWQRGHRYSLRETVTLQMRHVDSLARVYGFGIPRAVEFEDSRRNSLMRGTDLAVATSLIAPTATSTLHLKNSLASCKEMGRAWTDCSMSLGSTTKTSYSSTHGCGNPVPPNSSILNSGSFMLYPTFTNAGMAWLDRT